MSITKKPGTYVEWRIEVRTHWEDEIWDWRTVHQDNIVDRHMQRPDRNHHSPFGDFIIWYTTEEEARTAINRFQEALNKEDVWDRSETFGGEYYTEAQYEFRIRKYTLIVEEPIEVVPEPHPATLKRRPGLPHWDRDKGGRTYRRRAK